ncbi:hypothetical protein CCO03_09510 [Comamonas serinivorans]|uniref:Uncharacterized protein n=1 Tax=Comamonas serinivorans TaxID=1082851 RepID=A0A1Y0EMK7_9BURK|nr:hypothetical protein [Comamonas serinivorans]ARU04885.1 hypothetical protein CCO03_09510 [Comamonas serinivorans]
MSDHTRLYRLLLCLALTGTGSVAWSQGAPGEDPVLLGGNVSYQAFPTAAEARSGALDPADDLPAWLRAKVSRYEAQSFTSNPNGIATDSDIVNTTRSAGTRKTCVQEVGSSTTMLRPGTASQVRQANNNTQVVVLRGDLVNVCR